MKKLMMLACMTVFVANCGVLLHPERQGQKSGRIDPAIAILDGVGLLLFVIPGLVAFAIDFHQGTIYLPGGSASSTDPSALKHMVKIEGEITEEKIEAALKKELSLNVDLTDQFTQAYQIERHQLETSLLAADKQRATVVF